MLAKIKEHGIDARQWAEHYEAQFESTKKPIFKILAGLEREQEQSCNELADKLMKGRC